MGELFSLLHFFNSVVLVDPGQQAGNPAHIAVMEKGQLTIHLVGQGLDLFRIPLIGSRLQLVNGQGSQLL